MKSTGKKVLTNANGIFKVDSQADKTLVRFTGAGSCTVQAAWNETEGHSFAAEQALMENVVVVIDCPIKFLKVSGVSGDGSIIIEGYN